MKTLITAVALVAFLAGNAVSTGAFAQASSAGAPPPAANMPAVAPTTPTTGTETTPPKSPTHRTKTTHRTSKKSHHAKSTKSS